MDAHSSISVWLGRLKAGESAAAQPLWKAYYGRMVELARRVLGGRPRAAADEEDAALSAFNSFWGAVQKGRFPDLEDRHDLWQVLLMLTARKAIDQMRGEARQKRGGGQRAQLDTDAFAEVMGREPTPALAAQVAEECRRLLYGLDDAVLQTVAVAKMEGYSNAEIAERLGCSVASVERKLRLIRETWSQEAAA